MTFLFLGIALLLSLLLVVGGICHEISLRKSLPQFYDTIFDVQTVGDINAPVINTLLPISPDLQVAG